MLWIHFFIVGRLLINNCVNKLVYSYLSSAEVASLNSILSMPVHTTYGSGS